MKEIKILTHDGAEYTAAIEEYDAITLNEQLNSPEINTVIIGEFIFSRINIKSVVPIDESQ
ncbi:hypothetical protein FZC78_19100 [Rossellomorea vietnamensis]|uniref:Uncharacterized protein n=1 Tax=Rossellomorea vietnamensis TaxID=218284 RepID=A0A5D4NJ78_9BACI|nr:hypothetical protein [Rossellomorea vietnamensis]TYS14265.1 hypothetical protein FZC78_19100 [Rossellomorea vietnamensis]